MNEIITLIDCLSVELTKKKELNHFRIIIHAILTMNNRITMKGLSRWSDKGGSYSTINRFFHTKFDWLKINWVIIKTYLKKKNTFILGGDEVVVTKSGKKTFGIDRFFHSTQNQVVKGISFLNISLIDVDTGKAWNILMKQITKENKEGCVKDRSGKKNDENKDKEKRKVGRPKGSTNKDKSKVQLSTYFKFVQDTITVVLNTINKFINITYFVFDGEFGNNNAAQMILQKGLQLISKLRHDSALYFKYEGENKRKKYGDKIDYDNIPDKYLVETKTGKKGFITKIFQIEMLHKTFPKSLNIVIIVKSDTKNNRKSHVVLFSTDLNLGYENLIKYYSLRFQIEFIFRDAKQHWGLEDFMNIKEEPVNNFANLSTFMVNFSYLIREKLGDEKMSIINLKLRFHGMKYVDKVLKLLPKKPDDISLNQIYDEIANIGSIEKEKKAS